MTAIAKQRSWPPVKYSQTRLGSTVTQAGQVVPGGLDLTTPSLMLPPGTLIDACNFECAQSGGYARCDGYERYDGHAAPSDATYTIVQIDQFFAVPSDGTVVTQATSGATGIFIGGGVTSANESYLILTQVSGTFDQTHALTIPGPLSVGTATTLTLFLTSQLKAVYKAAAAGVTRALIGAVPGSGAIRGVLAMNLQGADNLYAFRDGIASTNIAIYKATASGWTLVPFYKIVSFVSGGTLQTLPGGAPVTIPASEDITVGAPLVITSTVTVQGSLTVIDAGASTMPEDGDTLTQGGVTATIKRVMWASGAWAGSATGRLVITTPSGGSFAAGAAFTSGATSTPLVLTGVQTTITLAPGGKFEFVKTNFSGDIATRRAYGCDGVNQAFEFDGDILAPIASGLSPDVPSHITAHKNYLILSRGSSIMGSAPGLPFDWSAIDGAWEIATGDTVNAMITLPGDQTNATLAVLLKSNTAILYGTNSTNFNFVVLNTGIGTIPYSVQNMFDTMVLDTLGVITLKTTLNYGNFLPSTLTRNILPFIARERDKTTASIVVHEKAQYRLFFSDGYALCSTVVNQQYLGSIPLLWPNPVNVCDDTTLTDSSEAIYFGSNDGQGYVYQMDRGTSFDGAPINAYFTTAWDPIGSPRMLKRFRAASLEVQGGGYAAISYSYQLGYGNPQVAQPSPMGAVLNLVTRARWDDFIWDEFEWDGVGLLPTDVSASGTAVNIQPIVSSATDYMSSYTVNSIIHHYTVRRGMRV